MDDGVIPPKDICSKVEAKEWSFKEYSIRGLFSSLILFAEKIN